ncbi:MAG: MFS transporter [Pseudomonadota bacterium]
MARGGFLVGGTLLMALSMSGMAMATAYWQILVLALLSGMGNSVIHPADYAILAGSVNRQRMGRSFALHTFSGNVGSSLAPPITALLIVLTGWRGTLLTVGLFGVPVVLLILWQSRILQDQVRPRPPAGTSVFAGSGLLMTRPILPVLRLLPAERHVGRGRAGLAHHRAPHRPGHEPGDQLLGADRLHGRRHQRHPGRRLGRRSDGAGI